MIPNAQAQSDLYWISFAVFPTAESQCVFIRAADPESGQLIGNFVPSTTFMKAACRHFDATWQQSVPDGMEERDFRIAVWHRATPDEPTYLRQANM